ncbi:MAG TPA: CoA transferase [Candidatus Binatia bacterium]|jgi:crotonobetainyl-CoA:carnitine CoA-transferase CaiB-like acyl-CoA transferase
MPGALDDIRVIDFTHALNGPFCTMLLGHLGAEVIKIEPPEGDGFRRSWMPPDAKVDGYEFLWVSVNKKSVVLNLKTEKGADLARQLIAKADVVVENYHTGTMEKFGLGYDALKQINPRIIYACSRGFGETGPYKDYGSTAHTNNSMTGWTHTGWNYSGAPGTKAIGIGDEAAGVSMVVGILAALHARERTGEGQRIVVSMQEALLGFMISEFHEHFIGIEVGNYPVPVADGYFTLRMPDLGDNAFKKLTKFMDRDDLVADPRFATIAARKQNRGELHKIIKEWAQGKTRQELWEGLRQIGYFGAPVLSMGEVIDDSHIKERNAFVERNHPTAGPVKLLAPWIHMSKTPASIRFDSPALGQHTNEVLRGLLGLSDSDLIELRARGAVK